MFLLSQNLRYALLAAKGNNHTFFSCHFECFIYEAIEKNVCAVGAKLFLTHQKPSRPLQLTQMEGLEVFSLGGGNGELE